MSFEICCQLDLQKDSSICTSTSRDEEIKPEARVSQKGSRIHPPHRSHASFEDNVYSAALCHYGCPSLLNFKPPHNGVFGRSWKVRKYYAVMPLQPDFQSYFPPGSFFFFFEGGRISRCAVPPPPVKMEREAIRSP